MPLRALIVDDSQQVASTLEIALTHAGWETEYAPDVRSALAILDAASAFDAIVTDIEMPGADGYALIAAVRAHPRHAGIVVAVASGSTDPNAEERARSAGAGAFFAKPYSPAAVRQELERLATGRGQVGT